MTVFNTHTISKGVRFELAMRVLVCFARMFLTDLGGNCAKHGMLQYAPVCPSMLQYAPVCPIGPKVKIIGVEVNVQHLAITKWLSLC